MIENQCNLKEEFELMKKRSFVFIRVLHIVHGWFADHRIDVEIKLVTIRLDGEIDEREGSNGLHTDDEDTFQISTTH